MATPFNMNLVFGLEHRKAYMGLAMLWIIGYHFYLEQSEIINHYLFPFKLLFRNGFVGVDIFFILSAYGLCCSWERSKVVDFYKKRFMRIIPLYLLFLVLCKYILHAHHVLVDGLLQISSLSVFNTSFTRTQEMRGEWFVPAIINLYLIFPLLFIGVKWMDSRFPRYGAYIVAVLCIIVSGGAISLISPNYIMRLPVIAAGILAYLYVQKNDKQKLLRIYVLMAVFCFLIERKNIMLSVPLPLILFALNEMKFQMDRQWLNIIGGISFELYLAHVIPMNFIHQCNIFVAVEIMLVGTILLTFLFHGINLFVKKIR